MSELRCLHEGTVTEEQIDHLGHMNVRFYATRALAASRALAEEYGLDDASCAAQGLVTAVPDQFTRHYREQLQGARLGVMTGVLAAHEGGLHVYHELRNLETDELSATFVHRLTLQDRETRAPRPFPSVLAERAGADTVAWPEHGRPRSLDLDLESPPAPEASPSLADVRERDLAMRHPRSLEAELCDADGLFDSGWIPELVWGGEPVTPRTGPPLYELPGGVRMGWATLESRSQLFETPRAGARVQSFGADVEFKSKTSLQHFWVFDLQTEQLVARFSVVNLAFDTVGRRAIEIPDRIRAEMAHRHHPDLR